MMTTPKTTKVTETIATKVKGAKNGDPVKKHLVSIDTRTLQEAGAEITAELARRGAKGPGVVGGKPISGAYEMNGRRVTNTQNLQIGDHVVFRGHGRNEGRMGRITRLAQVRGDVLFDGDKEPTCYLDLTDLLRCQTTEDIAKQARGVARAASGR